MKKKEREIRSRKRVGEYGEVFTKKRPRKMPDLQSGIGIGRPSVID